MAAGMLLPTCNGTRRLPGTSCSGVRRADASITHGLELRRGISFVQVRDYSTDSVPVSVPWCKNPCLPPVIAKCSIEDQG